MKAISLYQPWASLVANGAKCIETRSWKTPYTGLIAIHATLRFPVQAESLCFEDAFYRGLFGVTLAEDQPTRWQRYGGGVGELPRSISRIKALPLGAVVATARLVICESTDSVLAEAALEEYGAPDERRFGDYSPGRWMWILADVVPLAKPIPAKGARGLWEWNGEASR